jgi:hypothetical protein
VSILVDEHSYLLEVSRYIHLNPVRASIVEFPEEYRWSRLKAYLHPSKCRWIFTEEVLSYMGGSPRRYLNFLHEAIDKEEKIPTKDIAEILGYAHRSAIRLPSKAVPIPLSSLWLKTSCKNLLTNQGGGV